MDQSLLDQYLSNIESWRSRESYERAMDLVEEAFKQGLNQVEIHIQAVGLGFLGESWRNSLVKRLLPSLKSYNLAELCGGANRLDFLRLVREYSGFRTMLLDYLITNRKLDGLRDWIALSEPADQRWLIKNWYQAAKEMKDPEKANLLLTATGVGLFVIADWEGACRQWSTALENDPGLFQLITTFFKESPKVDLHQPNHRLRLIQLIAATGKTKEARSLLQALGLESQKNARALLTEMPSFLNLDQNSMEMFHLRFNLAIFLGDPEILGRLVHDLKDQDDSVLFDFKKQVRTRIKDARVRYRAWQEFARIHIQKEEWEPAAAILEDLFDEDARSDTVLLMEQVVGRYPILSKFHFKIGTYYFRLKMREKALKYFEIAINVPDYKTAVQHMLEDRLSESYDPAFAALMLGSLSKDSHKAGLLAYMIVINEGTDCEPFIEDLASWKTRKVHSPFWHLALMQGYIQLKRYAPCIPILEAFLLNNSKLSAEGFRYAEALLNNYQADYSSFISLMETLSNALVPKETWALLRQRFIDANSRFKAQGGAVATASSASPNSDNSVGESTDPPIELVDDSEKLHELNLPILQQPGNEKKVTGPKNIQQDPIVAPAELSPQEQARTDARATLESMRDMPAQRAESLLQQLEQWTINHPQEPIWARKLIHLLLEMKNYPRAAAVGHRAISNPHFKAERSEFAHLTGLALIKEGKPHEAFPLICRAAKNPEYFKRHRSFLLENVLPDHHLLLKDVAQLVLQNEDETGWGELVTNWHRHYPEQMTVILKAQETFANSLKTPRSFLDLAFWQLQAGKILEVDKTLERIKLDDLSIRKDLIRITNLARLKFPGDPKPRFVLGRFYLLNHEVSNAVDAFRELVAEIPKAAGPIFKLLRTFLEKKPDRIDTKYLYGLLVRFSLSYGTPVAAVHLLREFGTLDQPAAETLTDGVFRVLCRKPDNQEAFYELARLHFQWKSWDNLLKVNDRGNLGTHMAIERLEWLAEASREEQFRDRALLAMARLQFEDNRFEACRSTLGNIEDARYRRQTLSLYERLIDRFPQDLNLYREAAWVGFTENPGKSREWFKRVYAGKEPSLLPEAYAALKELGENPDFEILRGISDSDDQLFQNLSRFFQRFREMELSAWEENGGNLPLDSLKWLLQSGRLERFRQYLPLLDTLPESQRNILEAQYLKATGAYTQAAWRLNTTDQSIAAKQSYFCQAGLAGAAVNVKVPHQRLPRFVRELFVRSYKKPALIQAQFTQVRAMQKAEKSRQKDVI